ncbi:MAG: hypothetical protein M1838_001086 [Thelocarpon superellum]|nr:MAG: hypothetical protein M1838_001086 [Thelocarpon superellum]
MPPSKGATMDWTTFHNIVDGKSRKASSVYHGINPANKQSLWDAPVANQQDLDDAVRAARRALPAWSSTPIEERARLLRRYSELCERYEKDIAELLIQESGKPRMSALEEIRAIQSFARHHTKLRLPVETVEERDRIVTVRYVPLGLVAAICPWNFPVILSFGKIAPAMMTGNCIIVKPSPFAPYTALKLVELAQRIFPHGVIQALGGDDQLGPWMTQHPNIDKISFTGSAATGKKVMEACSRTLKRVTLELGGNDASIVCSDIDVRKVAPQLAMGALRNSGQVCVATKRIYIHESIYDRTVKAMSEVIKKWKIGPGDEHGISLGPVQNEGQFEKIKDLFTDSTTSGYRYAVRGEIKESEGVIVEPIIVDNPLNDSHVIVEEAFGPIVPCQPWNDEEEVIRRANDSRSGLGACVWSQDLNRARRIASRLEAGSVWINSYEKLSPSAYFSGVKESGLGGEWGTQGLLAYCNAQTIHEFK